MRRFLAVSSALLCSLGACADDALNEAGAPTAKVEPGSITGRVCDRDAADWLAGVTAKVTLDDGTVVSDTTGQDGRFTLEGIAPGEYYVELSGAGYENVFAAVVRPGSVTSVGATSCDAAGSLRGRVCDETTGQWVAGATVTLDDPAGTSTVSDGNGRFAFNSIVPGTYTLTITSPSYSGTRSANVVDGQTTDLGPAQCQGGSGVIHGRICGGDGYWLSGARVYVDLGNGAVVETTTDASGYYTLTGVPGGTQTVQVERGAFSTSFPVDVAPTGTTEVQEPVCLPPTTRLAVVTGVWDAVEHILADLGFPTRNVYNTTTPTTQDPNGNVDIIDGWSTFWIDEFLADPTWMAQYDIIFFNCGIDDSSLIAGGATATTALTHLQDFVAAGGSIYASDWASEVVRIAFPNRINFLGDDGEAHAARVGMENDTQGATVLDPGLATALGRTSVTVNLLLNQWVVLDTQASQPSSLRVLVRGSVPYSSDGWGIITETLEDSPLVVQFGLGNGRVLFTSVHNEGQNTPDLEDILRYIVFEL